MKTMYIFSLFAYNFVLFIIVSNNIVQVELLEPISTGAAIGVALVGSFFVGISDTVVCRFKECCDSKWIKPNFTALEASFTSRLHGQHLVRDAVMRSLKAHLDSKQPSKALVLSFHGWTGGGKNFVSTMIADSLYKKGMLSRYVHLFVSTVHFPLSSQHTELYKSQLQNWIRGNVTLCERSMFIFDEIDKMSSGMLDAIKPFLDHYQAVNGVDYRKTIFIFLSNTAGSSLAKHTLSQWEAGRKRTDLTLKEMEDVIMHGAFNEEGFMTWVKKKVDVIHQILFVPTIEDEEHRLSRGLWHSSLISKHLISVFVPFLPLEQQHVRLCVADELKARRLPVTDEMIQKVVSELTYFPSETQLFSTSGCKKVTEKLAFSLVDD